MEVCAHACHCIAAGSVILIMDYLYRGPSVEHALKSAPSRSIPNAFHVLGLKILSSGTLCMHTGILSIEARVINSAPICP